MPEPGNDQGEVVKLRTSIGLLAVVFAALPACDRAVSPAPQPQPEGLEALKPKVPVAIPKERAKEKVPPMKSLQELRAALPTERWKNSSFHTKESLRDCEAILLACLDALAAAKGDRDAQHEAFKTAVLAFNAINEKYDCPIETMERDDLGVWFEQAAKAVGYLAPDAGGAESDFTLEWREW